MEKLRAYQIQDKIYPSVTSVISYTTGLPVEMKGWIGRNAALRVAREYRKAIKEKKKITQKKLVELGLSELDDLLKDSQLKGTTLHTWAEMYYNTQGKFTPEPLPKEYKGYWNSFLRFNEYYKLEAIKQEMVVYSHEYKFAGRMDFYGTLTHQGQTKRVLVDFKTSNFLKNEYGLQLAAYKYALESMGFPVDECYILHLRSHGFYEFVRYDKPFVLFKALKMLFDDKVRSEKPEFELAYTPEEYVQKFKTAG